jgi:hypothetical protein
MPAGPEGKAGALAFAFQSGHQPSPLSQGDGEQAIGTARTVTRKLASQDDGSRALARVLHAVLRANQGTVATILGHHPIQDPLQGLA